MKAIPHHVAIIMDGNGRWAEQRGKLRHAGHKAGLNAVRAVIEASNNAGVAVLTLFAFSSENWHRPKSEINFLMDLFITALDREIKRMHEKNIRMRVIGDITAFSPKLQQRIQEAEQLTKDNTALLVQIAANYGGRWDITQAARKLAEKVRAGELEPADIGEAELQAELSFSDIPDPDLFIRTGGEQRISNFILWQSAYTELYFTELLWPDFDQAAFDQALIAFAGRQRRFGRTGAQLENQA